jgi:cytochrome c553
MRKYSLGRLVLLGIIASVMRHRRPRRRGSAMRHLVVALGCALAALAAGAQDQPYFVANCFTCHGTDGRSSGAIPALAGMNKDYFVEQIRLFKSGARQATVMAQLAKGYSDEEMAIAAEFFAKQKK